MYKFNLNAEYKIERPIKKKKISKIKESQECRPTTKKGIFCNKQRLRLNTIF